MQTAIIIGVAAGAGLIALLTVLMLVFDSLRKRLSGEVERRFAGREVLLQALNANFFGQQSRGVGQIRGNGALVLTADELWFLLGIPRREISIPLRDITSVSLVNSHLGKSVFRPLLHVEYLAAGTADAIAWAVDDPERWKATIEQTTGRIWP
jgi:hypothetical protein